MSLRKTGMKMEEPAAPVDSGSFSRSSEGAPAFQLSIARSLRMHPRLALSAGLAVLLLALGYGLSRTSLYEAESLTYIEPLASKVLNEGALGTYDPSRYDSYLQQQMQTAQRPDILGTAIGKLPAGTWQRPGESLQSAVARLQVALKVQRVTTSYQLSISLQDPDPQVAAAVVNAVTLAYLEQGRKDEHALADQRLRLLGEERQRIHAQLALDRTEQAELGLSLGVANPSGLAGNPFDLQVTGVRSQVAGAQEAHDIAAAQLASLHASGSGPAGRGGGLIAAADELISSDSGLNSMKASINERKAVLSSQMAGLTASNPIYKQDQAEIVDLDRSLDAMTGQLREQAVRRLQDKMRADLNRTADVEGRLNAQLAQQTASATHAAPKLQRAGEIAFEVERLNARYATVDDSIRGLELESNGPGLAHLSVAATAPLEPEPNRKVFLLLGAFPLAVLAGIAGAVIAHKRDPRVYSGEDLLDVLGFPPMGVMPARHEVPGEVMVEYTLRLAAGLEYAYRVGGARSFVFTPASAGIRTGELLGDLQRTLADLGFRTLLADGSKLLRAGRQADRRDPLPPAENPGEVDRSSAQDDGRRTGHAETEILRLKEASDLLLIEAPPLLQSAEAEYLVRCADVAILIAESGVTLRNELRGAAHLLRRVNAAGVGAVLQEVHLSTAETGFRVAVQAAQGGGRAAASRSANPASSSALAAADLHVEGAQVLAARELVAQQLEEGNVSAPPARSEREEPASPITPKKAEAPVPEAEKVSAAPSAEPFDERMEEQSRSVREQTEGTNLVAESLQADASSNPPSDGAVTDLESRRSAAAVREPAPPATEPLAMLQARARDAGELPATTWRSRPQLRTVERQDSASQKTADSVFQKRAAAAGERGDERRRRLSRGWELLSRFDRPSPEGSSTEEGLKDAQVNAGDERPSATRARVS